MNEKSDVFQFGALLYEVLTGERAYTDAAGDGMAIVAAMTRYKDAVGRVRQEAGRRQRRLKVPEKEAWRGAAVDECVRELDPAGEAGDDDDALEAKAEALAASRLLVPGDYTTYQAPRPFMRREDALASAHVAPIARAPAVQALLNLLDECLRFEPAQRPSFASIAGLLHRLLPPARTPLFMSPGELLDNVTKLVAQLEGIVYTGGGGKAGSEPEMEGLAGRLRMSKKGKANRGIARAVLGVDAAGELCGWSFQGKLLTHIRTESAKDPKHATPHNPFELWDLVRHLRNAAAHHSKVLGASRAQMCQLEREVWSNYVCLLDRLWVHAEATPDARANLAYTVLAPGTSHPPAIAAFADRIASLNACASAAAGSEHFAAAERAAAGDAGAADREAAAEHDAGGEGVADDDASADEDDYDITSLLKRPGR